MKEMQVCSQAVYDILVAFNNLSSLSEQEEVLDVIYEALYKKVLREVMSNSIIIGQKAEIQELEIIIQEKKVAMHNMQEIIQASSNKKGWKNTRKKLLIIIGNLKHYLGDSWQTIFPFGSKNIDAFLKQIDSEGILDQDTWSCYENAANTNQEQ